MPVFQKGEKENVENYRPIFSKALERIMCNRLHGYFKNNNFLQQSQFGFQMNNSTEHLILQFTREIAQNIYNGKFTLVVFIDLLKAFDSVDHQILLTKLKHYGVIEKATAWLRSYLFQKEQYIENYNDIKYLRSVTQGPILRP